MIQIDFKKNKKKIAIIVIIALLVVIITSFLFRCSSNVSRYNNAVTKPNKAPKVELYNLEENYKGKRVAVIYFAVSDNTKNIAYKIATIFNADPIEIVPEKPYTAEDLNFDDPNSRVSLENNFYAFDLRDENGNINETIETEAGDKSIYDGGNKIISLPKIKNIDVKKYSVIFLGYPLWFGEAPKVMYTFINNKDLNGKIIIPFCTSDTYDIGMSDQNLAEFSPNDVNFMSGEVFTGRESEEEVKDWVTRIGADMYIFD